MLANILSRFVTLHGQGTKHHDGPSMITQAGSVD